MCVRIFSLTFLVLFFTGCPEFFYIPPPPPSPPPSPTLPSITQQPQDLVVKTGEEARFEVWFSSNAKEFRWGTKNPEGQISYYNWSPTDGWTWASITFPSASLSQSGTQIWLEARNSAGTTSSRKATLTVLPHATADANLYIQPTENILLVFEKDNETLAVIHNNGVITSGVYLSSNGESLVVTFTPYGLPKSATSSSGTTIQFENYSNSSVDLHVTDGASYWEWKNEPISLSDLSELFYLASSLKSSNEKFSTQFLATAWKLV